MAVRPSVILAIFCVILAGCGGRLVGSDGSQSTVVAPAPQSTPSQRAVQVAWTAASARYCAFGLNPEKLKADYLAWETAHGASPETVMSLDSTYDKAFRTFYDKVKETPGYCSKQKIEEIRPEINRHLAGDYEPKKDVPEPDAVALPSRNTIDQDYSVEKALTPTDSR